MTERFDFSFPFHGLVAAVKLLYVYYLLWLMYSRVSSASSLFMQFYSALHILGISSVVTAIFAKKDVDIVGHQSSTHRWKHAQQFSSMGLDGAAADYCLTSYFVWMISGRAKKCLAVHG